MGMLACLVLVAGLLVGVDLIPKASADAAQIEWG